jgi:hypothetical protein
VCDFQLIPIRNNNIDNNTKMAMNAGYVSLVRREGPPKHQGFFSSAEEVEEWASNGRVSDELLSFL